MMEKVDPQGRVAKNVLSHEIGVIKKLRSDRPTKSSRPCLLRDQPIKQGTTPRRAPTTLFFP
eukprot:scaffold38424_cov168-Amphora_coffeaeformis.AAC.5